MGCAPGERRGITGHQIAGRPVEYIKADDGSHPVRAVDKARQLVDSDGIDVRIGPLFAPANAAVIDYLSRSGGISSISIYRQPMDNMKTASGLSFVTSGLFSFAGYLTGKYAAEEMSWKTATCIDYEATAGRQIQEGFDYGFEEAGGPSSARISCRSTPSIPASISPASRMPTSPTGGSSATAPRRS